MTNNFSSKITNPLTFNHGGKIPYVSDDFQIGYDGAYEHIVAPNGEISNLTPEQYKLVRTPQFKAWFGDWENDPQNASKVVDENGEPLVVYHGTKYLQEFFEFEVDAIYDEDVKAFFFSKGYEHAKRYTFGTGNVKNFFLKAIKIFDPKSLSKSETRKIRAIFNPSVVQDFIEYMSLDGLDELKFEYNSNMSDEDFLFYILTKTNLSWGVIELQVFQYYLKSNNYNGFMTYEQVTNESRPNLNYGVFESYQIKLADGTNTTFDSNNADIRFAKGGEIDTKDKIYEVTSHYFGGLRATYNGGYFYKNGIFIRIKDHLANWNNFYEYNLKDIDENYNPYFLSIVIDGSDNKREIEQSEMNVEEFIIDHVEEYPNIKADEIIFTKEESVEDIILFLNSKINKMINMSKGGRTISQTPAPKKDRIKGSQTNVKGSASDSKLASSIKFNDRLETAIQNKVDFYNEKNPNDKVSLSTAKAVVRRGMGAFSTSYRPFISGGRPNSRQAWGLARLNKFLLKKAGVKVKKAYVQDDDLLKYAKGGKIGNGDCYIVAGRMALENSTKAPNGEVFLGTPKLVHGEVEGQNALNGVRYGHAWVEDDVYVYDFSNGKELMMLKEFYYYLGKIAQTKPKIYKYTFSEATEKMMETRNFGPWDLRTESGL